MAWQSVRKEANGKKAGRYMWHCSSVWRHPMVEDMVQTVDRRAMYGGVNREMHRKYEAMVNTAG